MEDCIDSVHRFNVSPIKVPAIDILCRSSITILLFIWEPQRILRKENKVGGIRPDFKAMLQKATIKTVYLQKDI